MTLAGSRSVVGGVHIQAFTFFVSRSRSVVRGAVVCVVCVVCCVGVGVRSWWCCVLCGWCVFLCFCVVLLFFSQFSSFSFFLLSSFPLLSSLFCLLFLFLFLFTLLFSPPNTVERTDQPTRRPTSRHLNVIWRTAGAQQSVLSLLLSSLLPEGTFNYRNISGEGFYLLQFLINSENSPPGKITGIN